MPELFQRQCASYHSASSHSLITHLHQEHIKALRWSRTVSSIYTSTHLVSPSKACGGTGSRMLVENTNQQTAEDFPRKSKGDDNFGFSVNKLTSIPDQIYRSGTPFTSSCDVKDISPFIKYLTQWFWAIPRQSKDLVVKNLLQYMKSMLQN